ncbi:MAG: dTMP kinase [Chloroflexota bacterium]|nr:dTMP kinase [Chloroflexota bacterium]
MPPARDVPPAAGDMGASSARPVRSGFFLTFEGIEGSGKSLQARLLVERLARNGIDALHTREPGSTPLGDHLRELVLVRDDLRPDARAEALLMCTSRAQLVAEVISPALASGRVVVCDRFADSTLVYQGFGRGLDIAELCSVISFATAGLRPDMTLLLDVPVETGLRRKHAQPAHSAWNRFEAEAAAFHERVRAGYRTLAAQEPLRWRCFDAQQTPAVLAEDIWRAVAPAVRLA